MSHYNQLYILLTIQKRNSVSQERKWYMEILIIPFGSKFIVCMY